MQGKSRGVVSQQPMRWWHCLRNRGIVLVLIVCFNFFHGLVYALARNPATTRFSLKVSGLAYTLAAERDVALQCFRYPTPTHGKSLPTD